MLRISLTGYLVSFALVSEAAWKENVSRETFCMDLWFDRSHMSSYSDPNQE